MDNVPSFVVYIILFFAIVGWLVSEIISRKIKQIESIYIDRIKLLKKEKTKLESSISKQKSRCTRLEEESVPLRESEIAAPALKKNHHNLSNELTKFFKSIDLLRVKLNNREYSSNPVTSEALKILEEYCPNEEEQKIHKLNKLQGSFTRIKNSMDGGG